MRIAALTGIDPGSANLDEHLAGTGDRPIDIGHVQHLAPAVAIETDRARLCSCHRDLPIPGLPVAEYLRLQQLWLPEHVAEISCVARRSSSTSCCSRL